MQLENFKISFKITKHTCISFIESIILKINFTLKL